MEGGSRHKKFKSPIKDYNKFKTTARPKSPSPKRKDFQKVALRKPDGKSRCTYIHPISNKRCKLLLGYYPQFCHLHTMMIDNLLIETSQIPNAGNGLFVGPFGFKTGDIIGIYAHPWMKVKYNTITKRENPDFSYIFCNFPKKGKQEECFDAIDIRSTILRHANDAHGSKFKNNAAFNNKGEVYATADINPFDEIFIDYGEDYDFHDGSNGF
jgi:hypothetical protein